MSHWPLKTSVEPYWLDTFNTQRNGRDQNTTPLAFAPTANNNIPTPAFVLYGRSTWDNTDTLALTSLAASDGTTIAGQVQGVGDFNGDGINDMLFSNGQMLLGAVARRLDAGDFDEASLQS